ncbi:MAG: NIPSNAP family protein [Acidobacteriota bacterium]|nr:NIPSNAP family protein [Acidobacteriota bacterium]
MKKWKMLAAVGCVFGVVGTGWGLSAQQSQSRVFELRIYKTVPGKRAELAQRFGDHTAAMFEKAGMDNVGYWNAATGDDVEDTFVYMLGYPSLEARDQMWETLGEDPDFQRIIIAAERSEERKLVASIDARMIVPTDYSALK